MQFRPPLISKKLLTNAFLYDKLFVVAVLKTVGAFKHKGIRRLPRNVRTSHFV